MRSKVNVLLFFILIVFSVGCTSQKNLTYFQGIDSNSADAINASFKEAHEAKVCAGDMLSIIVSGLDPEVVAPFNLTASTAASSTSSLYSSPTIQPYLVDNNGDIDFPQIGKIKLVGLTKSQAVNKIGKELSPFLKDIIVTLRFINYKVTVLGEVQRPGQYNIANERATILDAFGLAGDLTPYGKRNNILIIRDNLGKLEFVRLNLKTDEVLTSPYYYLQQNDVIYVLPNKVRAISALNVPLYLSTITTLASLVNVYIAVSRFRK